MHSDLSRPMWQKVFFVCESLPIYWKSLVMEILSVIRGLRRRDGHPERLGIVERLSFRKKTGRGPASPLPPRPPTMGGRGNNSLGGRSSSLGSSGGLQIEERGKGDTLVKGGRQAQGEICFTTSIWAGFVSFLISQSSRLLLPFLQSFTHHHNCHGMVIIWKHHLSQLGPQARIMQDSYWVSSSTHRRRHFSFNTGWTDWNATLSSSIQHCAASASLLVFEQRETNNPTDHTSLYRIWEFLKVILFSLSYYFLLPQATCY